MDKDLFNQKLKELKHLYSDQDRADELAINASWIRYSKEYPQLAIPFLFPFRFEEKRYLASELLQFHDEIVHNLGKLHISTLEPHKFKSLKSTEKLEFYKTNQFCSFWYFGEYNNSLKFIELFIKEICFFPSENFKKNFELELKCIKEIDNLDVINYFFSYLQKDKSNREKYNSQYNFHIHNLLFFLSKDDVRKFIRLLDIFYTLFLYFVINFDSDKPKLSYSEQIDSKVLKTLEEALDSLELQAAKAELVFIAKDFSSLVQFLNDQEHWFYEENWGFFPT